jgi:hypothetical protein
MPLQAGVATCDECGAKVGTVFDEATFSPTLPKPSPRQLAKKSDTLSDIEKAQERANSSVIMGLASFFCPFLGLLLGAGAIYMSTMATRTLTANHVEEGRGSATAGLIIGILGLIAQAGYLFYALKAGRLPFN